jgi:hypothetical protein
MAEAAEQQQQRIGAASRPLQLLTRTAPKGILVVVVWVLLQQEGQRLAASKVKGRETVRCGSSQVAGRADGSGV